MRNVTAALAVALFHAAAISVLLSTRELLLRTTSPPRPELVTYWIRLPEALPRPLDEQAPLQRGLPMLSIFGRTEDFSAPMISVPQGALPLTVLPSLVLPQNSTALNSIGEYFACSFVTYDRMTDTERQRCAMALLAVGPDTPIVSDYVDSVGTPFQLFGARGMVIVAGATRPYLDFLATAAGCDWAMGVCRPILPPTFGIDPDDQTRGSIFAQFDLGRGFSLYAGAQGYMQNFLGGARPMVTTGVRVTYRW